MNKNQILTNDDAACFIRRIREMGAKDAKVIRSASIVTAPWVRMKCQFGCSGYNKRLSCPPFTPAPTETQSVIDCFREAILVHCKPDTDVDKIVITLERELFLQGFYKALAFGAGPCRLCETCNLKKCAHPEQMRPSMEACGIDVYATVRGNGFTIEVVRDETYRNVSSVGSLGEALCARPRE